MTSNSERIQALIERMKGGEPGLLEQVLELVLEDVHTMRDELRRRGSDEPRGSERDLEPMR